jgi:hypothetical protein
MEVVLGDGQQLACFGIHPDTQQPYGWHRGEPGQIARQDLPYIHEHEARKLVKDIADLLCAEHGYRRKTEPKTGNGEDPDRGEGFDWSKFGDLLDHDNLCSVAMALIVAGLSKDATYNLLRSRVEVIETTDLERKQRASLSYAVSSTAPGQKPTPSPSQPRRRCPCGSSSPQASRVEKFQDCIGWYISGSCARPLEYYPATARSAKRRSHYSWPVQ